MHKARHNSPRLKPILDALMKAGKSGLTSLEVAKIGNTVAPGTSISELRQNNFDVRSEYMGRTENGRKLWRYYLAYDPIYDQLDAIG